ncbi:MAG: transposase [Candidatus Paceibacteria bacterium]
MKDTRRKFSSAFKTKVVLEALKERSTLSELSQKYEIHPNQIASWKREFLEKAEHVFEQSRGSTKEKDLEKQRDNLYRQIGQLKVENDWLKKKLQ